MEHHQMDMNYVKSTLQSILDRVHSHPEKRNIDERHDRFSMACPVCGDSHKDMNKKRGHVFFNTLLFKCYDNGCRMSFTKLCETFEITLDLDKKMEMIEHVQQKATFKRKSEEFDSIDTSKLIKMKDLLSRFNSGDSDFTNFKKVDPASKIGEYLTTRKLPDFDHIYEATHWKTATWSEQVMVFVNGREDVCLGMQTRNLKDGKARSYMTYNYSDLHKLVYPEIELDPLECVALNKLSYFHNIMNVNFEDVVTVFEGFLDSKFYPNALGMAGVNTDINYIMFDELSLQFFYDNDMIGHSKSEEMLLKGYNVFLWNKLSEKLALEQKEPIAFEHRFKNTVKDLNKLGMFFDNPYKSLKLDTYFSKDIFDKIFLDKKKPESKKSFAPGVTRKISGKFQGKPFSKGVRK